MIPEGWEEKHLGDCIATSMAGEWGGVSQEDECDIPVLRSTNFTNSGVIDYSSIAIRNIPKRKIHAKCLVAGDILLEKSGGSPKQPVGRVVYFESHKSFLYSNFIQKLTPASSCDNKYFFYKLFFEYQNGFVLKYQQQTTGIINFQLAEFLLAKGNFPPLPEQKKIAAILTSVDEAIEKQQAQISKLQDLKKAMMQELLTKGIGHTEFKDSLVGRIPKGWECCLLDEVARRGSGHTPNKQIPEYWNGGIHWVSLADSFQLDTRYIIETDKNISELGIKNSSAVLHPKGTVVLSRDAGIGKSTTLGLDMAVSQHFIAWVCGKKLNNFFLYYLLQLWKPKFEAVAMGSTIKTIGLSYFKKLQIPVPCVEEQQQIVSTLTSIDDNIEIKQKKLAQSKSLKKSLMQDLLTGKVRVPC